MEKVVIYGTGHHAEVIAYEMKAYNLHDVVAFTVKEEYLDKTELNGLPVVPYEELKEVYPPDQFKMFIAIGPQHVNRSRENMFNDAKKRGYSLVNCICPTPYKSEDLIVGENVYLDYASQISRFVEIGNNVIIIASQIGHHCKINDNAFVSGSIMAGNINLEKNVFIGLGSTIGPNITLGKHTVVGLGCVISKNTAPASVYSNQSTRKQTFDSSRLKLL
ncbi:hypothetical protein [Aequorivita marina]|uniref:PglD-related sugar-binding protein n=1 Tax=Aequorivita marina TaxID=3073654 RepID=UPI0028751A72|nr:hypothetical protein [Aequorivita sp. S2608]MDS1299058.1 hypothetical protein [Aequorivita sp. S2608]